MTSLGVKEKLELRLSALEVEFTSVLTAALAKCSDGSRGVFLSQEEAEYRGDIWTRLVWPETRQLKELDEEIRQIRAQLGMSDMKLAARFREVSHLSGPNVPGASKLAQKLLGEIQSGQLR